MNLRALLVLRARAARRIERLLSPAGFVVVVAADVAAARALLERESFDLVVVERALLDAPTPEALLELRGRPGGRGPVLVGDRIGARQRAALLAAGVSAVLAPDASSEQLRETLVRAASRPVAGGAAAAEAPHGSPRSLDAPPFVSRNPATASVLALARRVARSDSTLLLLGETGVGKEWLARAIHAQSARAAGPFVVVNCAAVPEALLESELFGHEAGAFTGALRVRRGYFELAHGGTLFLDEIGEMSPHLQAKLLRALQERLVQRLGAEREIPVDVRLMASTNRDLEEAMRAGTFRRDLYYRLAVIRLTLPPLRERLEDLPALAEHYLEHFRAALRRPEVGGMAPDTLEALLAYRWPGNVRELINVLERAVLLSEGGPIARADLPEEIARASSGHEPARAAASSAASLELAPWLDQPLARATRELQDAFERRYLERALDQAGGHLGRAAEIAGISPRTLYNKLRRLGLAPRSPAGR
jgi:DNA-binding NtrC family response regulator